MKLIIRHLASDGPNRFRVENPGNAKTADPATILPPDRIQVEGRPNSNLLQDLRWYLEDFLTYPFEPNTDIAERVQQALQSWGEETFTRLFSGRARDWYQEARRSDAGLAGLTVCIAGDDPRILAWPWEALRDPEGSTLAHACRIERRLNELHDPLPLPLELPRDRVNILLVVARPFGDEDVGYHALSRPLVELSRQEALPVSVDLLRPPTFGQLRQHLSDHPNHYHIVHFDGHGGYGDAGHGGTPHTLHGASGHLLFETAEGKEERVTAEQLTHLLSEYRIPVMVLNACQSARIDERAADPFASVAAALLKAGIRGVVAMGYNLYVSGAQQFVPAFYQRLFASGDVAEAARAGRQAMRAAPNRACVRGEFELQDWLVPVVYGQESHPLTFATPPVGAAPPDRDLVDLPMEATELGDYGFIGRESAVLRLERALRLQPQAGLLIHGMAGIGKTTLIQGFLGWLRETDGLEYPPLWLRFDHIRSAEFVVNSLVAALFETEAMAASLEEKIDALLSVLPEHPFLLVWDNFESVAGIEGTEVTPHLTPADRQLLNKLLSGLRGGKTKVLITSRSPEEWLTVQTCFRLPLGGLEGEECWQYCNAVVRDLGLTIDRRDPAYADVIRLLGGHPLAMRAVLLRLPERDAATLKKELEQGFAGAKGDESTRRIDAALQVLAAAFPPEFGPALRYVGLHQRYVNIDNIEAMSETAEGTIPRETLRTVFAALENAGQLHHLSQGVYSMHPALSGFLRRRYEASEPVRRGFVDFMGAYADSLAAKELHEQRIPFALHGGNFHYALDLAKKLKSGQHIAALTQSLAAYYQNCRDYGSAQRLFEELAALCADYGNQEVEASAYHQLGMIAQEQRDFKTAASWYQKSLAIKEKQGNEHGAASTYHHLGIIAEEQRDFKTAASWYQKSLAITEKQGNEHVAAMTYHQLGRIAQEQRDFKTAESWYQKSLAIEEKQGNEHGAATTYHHLGIIAQEQRDFKTAESWYQKSLAIKEKQGNEHGAATTYGQMGLMALTQGVHDTAAHWLAKAACGFWATGDQQALSIAISYYFRLLEQVTDNRRAELIAVWDRNKPPEMPAWAEIEKMKS